MIENSITNIPQIVLLRSDKVFNQLLVEILEIKDNKNNDSSNAFIEAVRDFYPNQYRLDEIELSLSQKELLKCDLSSNGSFNTLKYNFSFLKSVFDIFLKYDGSKILAKEKTLEEYLALITKISPLQIVGYELYSNLFNHKIRINDLFSFIDTYTPLFLRVDNQNKYAENHLHLKGASYTSFNMLNVLTTKTKKEYFQNKFINTLPRINEFSYINNHIYSIGQIIEITKTCNDYIYGSILDNALTKTDKYIDKLNRILTLNKSVNPKYQYSIKTISEMNKLFPIFKNTIEDNIIRRMIELYEKGYIAKVQLLENILFFYLYKDTESNYLRYFIKLYFQASNILRSYMVMSQNIGLSHFSEFSGSAIRQVENRNSMNIASSIINSGTNYLNAKMDVKTNSSKICNIVQDFKHAFDNQKGKIKFNFGLSSKKMREKEIKVVNLLPLFYKKRKLVKKEALALDDFIRNIKYKRINKFTYDLKYTKIKAYKEKHKLKNKILDMSSYVVSIDAVGKETHTPPEVFAPFFRYLRSSPQKLKNDIFLGTKKFQLHPKLLITVHAGEDFNHIITGMRRVDESVKFFNMKRNDRLGHVLSLGLFPNTWIKNIKDILVYKGDYFDDLVWLSRELKYLSKTNLDVSRYIKIYEDKIWKLFSEIYPTCQNNITISDLYEAWEYRKNCVLSYYKRKRGEVLFDDYSNIVLEKKPNIKVREIFELYQTNKKVRKNYQEVIKINKNNISKDEINIWRALQDKMINDLASKGLIIETNPSSNVFVSSINSYDYHPIFRFYPPKEALLKKGSKFNKFNQRKGRIAVTINSDDPAIFVTSLQNEYKTLKNVAKNKYKCTDKEAEDWINDIRKYGINLFKESYIESS